MADYPKGEITRDRYGELTGARFNFAGMNFLTDSADITLESGQCVDLCNVDVDYAYNISRRPGCTQQVSDPVSSMWQNDTTTFCVSDGLLSTFAWNTIYPVRDGANAVIPVLANTDFKQVNDVVFYTDGVTCGIIDTNLIATVITDLTLPSQSELALWVQTYYPNDYDQIVSNYEVDAFKVTPSPGRYPEFFNGVLYFAKDNFVFCTKTFDVESVDMRFEVVAGFPHNVTMIARVTDGIYIGTTAHIYFLRGTGFDFDDKGMVRGGFTQKQVATYGVIPGSNVRVNATLVPDAKADDTIVICSTPLGIFALANGGNYLNMSASQITMPIGTAATALFRQQGKVYQYIVCYNVLDGIYEGDPLAIDLGSCTDTVVVNTINLCHSRYSGFAFNSFITKDDRYYASCAKGIYELVGDTDFVDEIGGSIAIDAIILTPTTDFDCQEMKQVSDAFLHTRQTDDLILDVIVNENDEYEDFTVTHDFVEGIHRKRVKLPRGLKGTDWQFRLRNSNGCDFTAFDLEILVKKLKRII